MMQVRILVVEDERLVARDIEQQLLELGYLQVGHATRGDDAIVQVGQHQPDLVLMDIQLGGPMDGIEAAQAIRAQFNVPVVFLTAYAADDILARAKLVEPYGYILKPFSERELRTVLEMALYKHRAEARIEESAQYNQAILEHIADGVITISALGLIESFNAAACQMFGYTTAQVLGLNINMLMGEPHHTLHESFLKNYRNGGPARIMGHPRELRGLRQDGQLFPMTLFVTSLQHGTRTTYIGLVRDISKHQQDLEEIRRLAYYDALTCLPNRRLLLDRLGQAMLTSARTDQHGALMFIDLDHFKQLNDTLGHDVGDELLQQVAKRLRTCVREGDSVARLGGDEFVVLLEALSPHAIEAATQSELVAHKILHALGQPYSLRNLSHNSTPSIGIVQFLGHRQVLEDLLKMADVAMYQAKSSGRNTVCFFDPALQTAAAARTAFEKDLYQGVANNEFVLHYQIQVGRDGMPTGVEALVRWQHAVRGLVAPVHFIALAEETGLILPLGQWVLETACAQLVRWADHPATAHWTMAVNVSGSQFGQSDFIAHVDSALAKTGAKPHLLKLELTESMLLADVDAVIAKMNAIKERGVAFSLDDFGTGYSSLSYLKRLPLTQLKIDQSFVRDVLTHPSDEVIVRTILALGHSLGLTVIAEGVETAAQHHLLAKLGCDAFQGYFFGRPVAPDCVIALPSQLPDQPA
ncbi:MAG: EAL domain-containing protein [Rhodoferax sp.]|nr:EAL domain-containing protein [Rhodoferax sp.]